MKTNNGLIEYCKAQLGRPYWMGTFGQIATQSIYDYNKGRLPAFYKAGDFLSQYGQRVHDCIGLIKGYLWSDSPDAVPKYCAEPCPIDHSAHSMQAACRTGGAIATLPEIPGALVFFTEHVGVYLGGGKVIEARGHAYGVVETNLKDRPWTKWGLCPYISYEAEQEEEFMADQNKFNEMFMTAMQYYRIELRDNDSSDWSKEAREWAIKHGIIVGGDPLPNGEPNYMFEDLLTREQAVTLLHRFAQMLGLT